MSKYSNAIKEKAIQLYESGLSGKEVAEQLGLKPKTVHYWCRLAGVTRKRGPKSKIGNERYFQNIDTEEKAYWLGWLIADGNISCHNNQYSIKLHISIKDKELIYGFLQAVDSTNKVQERNTSIYVSLTSKAMYYDLQALGLTPAKSGKEQLPAVSPALVHHMIRGFFDGDGITCLGKAHRSGFCGSKQALFFIRNHTMLFPKIYQAKGTCYLLIGKKESKILYNYMYNNLQHGKANIWLQRKRQRMNIICGNTEVTTITNKMVAP